MIFIGKLHGFPLGIFPRKTKPYVEPKKGAPVCSKKEQRQLNDLREHFQKAGWDALIMDLNDRYE